MFNINFDNDWIRTTDLWHRKRQLYQLSHNHCPRWIYHLFIGNGWKNRNYFFVVNDDEEGSKKCSSLSRQKWVLISFLSLVRREHSDSGNRRRLPKCGHSSSHFRHFQCTCLSSGKSCCDQSYKQFTIIIYDSRVVLSGILPILRH